MYVDRNREDRMQDKGKRVLLWILIGIGTVSLISCGRSSRPDSESVDMPDMESVGGVAATGGESDVTGTDAAKGDMMEGTTGKSIAGDGVVKRGTAESATAGREAGLVEAKATKGSTIEDAAGKGMAENGAAKSGTAESSITKEGGADTKSSTGETETGTDATSSEGLQGGIKAKPEGEKSGSGAEEETAPREIPQLPETARELAGFVPEGWEIMDSVELDFNEDGVTDYVGVLEAASTDEEEARYPGEPRILFAVASEGTKGYRLDFQDINLIRTRTEGGVFGDPYMPLTAEGTSFTTHAYGGSAWRWSEDYTYTCQKGVWRLTSSETTYGYGGYTTSYSRNDWLSGTGIRKERSSEFSDMEKIEKIMDSGEGWDSASYDLEYELPLDGPVTLEQAGKRWWLARDRVTDWRVESVTCVAGAELPEEKVKHPDEAYLEYCDEDCVLYSFSDKDSNEYYLAMYRWEDRALTVVARENGAIGYPEIYKGKIYYTTEIVENVRYKTWQDGETRTAEEEDTVGVRLNRIAPDGTGKETVFEYRYPEEEQEIRENRIPYLALSYEIGGDQIVAEVYIGDEPHPFYRMKTDGSGVIRIGQVPGEQ